MKELKLYLALLAFALATARASRGADFFGVPDRTVVPKPAPAATPEPVSPPAATPKPARDPALPVPIIGGPADEAPPTLLPDGAYLKTPSIGGSKDQGQAFHDLGPDNGVLIGFEYTLGTGEKGGTVIESLTPLYVRAAGKAHGILRGSRKPGGNPAVVIESRPGFGVGAVEVRGGGGLIAFRITFMRYEDGVLDPTERYTTKWIGGESTEPAKLLRTDTRPIVGIYGKADAVIDEFGLIVRKEVHLIAREDSSPHYFGTTNPGGIPAIPTPDSPDEPKPAAAPLTPNDTDSTLLQTEAIGGEGNWGKPFRDIAPPGAMLVGFDYTTGTIINTDRSKIQSIQAIYLLPNGTKQSGERRGNASGPATHIEARRGFAVGAITAHAGTNLEGFLLTFLRIQGNTLLPNDSYDSPWIGSDRTKLKQLSSFGLPITGLYGKSNNDINQLGFLIRKDPTARPSAPSITSGTLTTGTLSGGSPAGSGGTGLDVFACTHGDFTLYLNGNEILSGHGAGSVQHGMFPMVKGDAITAVVKDSSAEDAWFSLRIVRDGKTLLDAGDMHYTTSETLNWKTNKLTFGFREPKIWTHDKKMGADPRPRAAWAGKPDTGATTLYFKALVP